MRLDEVKDHFGDQISITWKSFLLKPESKTPDREKFIRYTQGWERMAALAVSYTHLTLPTNREV